MKLIYRLFFIIAAFYSTIVFADEQPEITKVAVFADFGAPSVITQQPDCQNKNKIQTIQFPTTTPNYNFAKDVMAKVMLTLKQNDFVVLKVENIKTLTEKQADYLVSITSNSSPLPWDKTHVVAGYGIYSKAMTMGYINYQLTIKNLHSQQQILMSDEFLSTSLPDSKLLPKYMTCPIVAVDMPREDLMALSKWLQKEIIPQMQHTAITGLEAVETGE